MDMTKGKSGLEIIKERYGNTFESTLGAKFTKYEDSYCEVELEVKPEHLNIGNSVHGGVINALCDIALSGAVVCMAPETPSVVTLQMNVNFLAPGKLGDKLIAYGEIIRKGRRINYVEGGIKNQDGKLIARASGDWYTKL